MDRAEVAGRMLEILAGGDQWARDWAAATALIRDLRAADPDEAERVAMLLAAALAEAAGTGAE